MADIELVFSDITTVMGLVKDLKRFEKEFDEATFKLHRAEISSKLADIKDDIVELRQSLLKKDEEIREFKENLKLIGDMVYTDPYYQMKNTDGKLEGHYCKICFDADKKAIRLIELSNKAGWECGVCKNRYYIYDGPMMSEY